MPQTALRSLHRCVNGREYMTGYQNQEEINISSSQNQSATNSL